MPTEEKIVIIRDQGVVQEIFRNKDAPNKCALFYEFSSNYFTTIHLGDGTKFSIPNITIKRIEYHPWQP